MLTKIIYALGLLITLINTDVDADSLTTAQANFQAELTVSELEVNWKQKQISWKITKTIMISK